jgi:hypothetical protein
MGGSGEPPRGLAPRARAAGAATLRKCPRPCRSPSRCQTAAGHP